MVVAGVLGWVVVFGDVVVVAADDVPVPAPMVDVVPVVAEYVAVGVPLYEEGGAVLVVVTGVVGPALGVCGEDPQAAASSTPTAKVVTLTRRTCVPTVAHLLRHIHCRATDPGAG